MRAMGRGFDFARELGSECGPVHFLVGIAEGGGPLGAVLAGNGDGSLRSVVTADPSAVGQGATYLHTQAQGAARDFATSRGEPVSVEHLLVALCDQADPTPVEAMRRADVDAGRARSAALAAIGAPVDQPRIALPPLTPAGTLDRPPLPLSELPTEARAVLQARQDRLPLSRLHRTSDWFAIMSNESRAVARLAKRFKMDDDRACSLQRHHDDAVTRRAHEVAPGMVDLPRDPGEPSRPHADFVVGPRPWRSRHPVLGGWGCWFGNRRIDLHAAWLRLTVQH